MKTHKMDSLDKETLDFSIVSDGDTGYAIRLRGSIFEGIEYRYTLLKFEERAIAGSLYFDYEIIKNPNKIPLTDELRNFIAFISERLVRSGLVKVKDEANRNNDLGRSTVQ
jgi:hypothetical protein